MEYLAITLAVLGTVLTVLHRTMIGKIYDSDSRVLSRFALPKVIRQEYSKRYGKDGFYWCSKFLPVLFGIIVVFMIAMVLTKNRL
jgi:hypothetical protein